MVDLYCLMWDYPNEVAWPRIYFSIYFYLVALIILNIIISFVLEIYDSVSSEVDKQFDREKYLKKLASTMPDGRGLSQLITRVNQEQGEED